MTRRVLATVCVLCVLASVRIATGEGPRIEVGLGGYFPLGAWVRCRVSGLPDVADGQRIVVHVGETFRRELTVTGGAAEGLVLMTEELPRIAVAMPDGTRIELPDEATRHLRAVRDRLPAVGVGTDVPDNTPVESTIDGIPVTGIWMTPAEFAARDVRDLDWVHVFVLGPMTSSERDALRESVLALVRLKGAVVMVSPDAVTGWLRQLPFEDVSDRVSACNFENFRFFAPPRGVLRPRLFEIFGAAEWPRST
ncbi:MAG TPA: hypothetical protein VMX57_04245, partial [Planctomycetota bacterium]|nr:hypothetical protein [Planctomycetota bacterium]